MRGERGKYSTRPEARRQRPGLGQERERQERETGERDTHEREERHTRESGRDTPQLDTRPTPEQSCLAKLYSPLPTHRREGDCSGVP